VKPLYLTLVKDSAEQETALYATALSRNDFSSFLANYRGETCLFCQERIWKVRDVRLLFLPNGEHLACEIDNSILAPNTVDWRPQTMALNHKSIDLPNAIKACAEKYLRIFKLPSGSFDFGITSAGDWIFFECNPNGQWLWMELKTGIEIGRRFAKILLHHHNGNLDNNQENHIV